MSKLFELAKWTAAQGRGEQNFLGAKWISTFLKWTPPANRRLWALRLLSLSPHYFIFPNAPEYRGMSNDEYLEASYADLTESRENIHRFLLKEWIDENSTVLDYGCGPGFLAKAVSPHVKRVIGVDISSGVIACARLINFADNIEYLTAGDSGMKLIDDHSIDVIYSYAVVQHVSEQILSTILLNCKAKLKPGGKLLMHVQFNNEVWRSENEWASDATLSGRAKFRLGLHCFGRSQEQYSSMVANRGFDRISFKRLEGFDPRYDEELDSQRLLVAYAS